MRKGEGLAVKTGKATPEKAFERGRKNYLAGIPPTENPYLEAKLAKEWERGYEFERGSSRKNTGRA